MSALIFTFFILGIFAAGIAGYLIGYGSRRKWERTIEGDETWEE